MDSALPARRPGPLLALALAASTALAALSPAVAAPRADAAGHVASVVVTSASEGAAAVAQAVRAAGGTVRDVLPLVGGVSATLPAGVVLPPAYVVVDDAPLQLASRDVASKDRQATAVRAALGLGAPAGEGAGVTVAVVDTGVAETADLAGRLTHVDVSGTWADGEAHDPHGHGTFVAGVVAGDGAASGGRYAGVAPGASVLDVRVADDEGRTDLSTVLRGLQVAADRGADVVNLSLASGSPLPWQVDPLTVALGNLWAQGAVVVVPTGNDGPAQGSVTSPGTSPVLLTVGALDEQVTADRGDDVVPAFSGRGPAPQGVAKPDLVAPGRSVVSLRAVGSAVDAANPGARLDGTYFRGSGTSFATAAVSGAAAALLGERDLAPAQVKALVTGTAYDGARGLRDPRDAGAGGLDPVAALAAPAPTVADEVLDPAPPAGDVETWHAFLQALLDGDRSAAARAWSQLSPEAHRWAANSWSANSWSAHRWGAHRWGANSWSAHRWAGDDASADEWELRLWAAHRWAAHRWATDEWVANSWSANSWSAHRWAEQAEQAANSWSANSWSAHRWAAHRWAASRWAASRWAADDWG